MSQAQVQVKWLEGTISLGIADKHSVAIDRPLSAGGTEVGFRASELLLLSLGGCFSSTLIGAASARQLKLVKLEINVGGEKLSAPERFGNIEVQVELVATDSAGVELNDNELDKLIEIAERGCFVTNTLRAGTPVSITRIEALALLGR